MSKRDESFVLNEYDVDKWPSVIKLIKEEKGYGESNIIRILNKINTKNRNNLKDH